MFEHRNKNVIERPAFLGRMGLWLMATLFLTAISLGAGMIGYRLTEGLNWIDAFLNAAMILGGMGEVADLRTTAGKLFAGFYAIYCSIFIILCGGLLLLPVFHRVLHVFHADADAED